MSRSTARRATRPPWAILSALLLGSIVLSPLYALAQGEEAPSAPTARARSQIRERMENLKADEALEQGAKDKATELYELALTHLRSAEERSEKAASYAKQAKDAPALLETIRSELQETPSVPAPEVSKDDSSEEIEQALNQAQAALQAAQKKAEQLKATLDENSTRRRKLPELIAETGQGLQEVKQKLEAKPETEGDVVAAAERAALAAEQTSLEQELAAYNEELASLDVVNRVLTAQRDLALKRVSRADKQVDLLQALLARRRRSEAESAAREAGRLSAQAHPQLKELAEENARLAEMRTGAEGLSAAVTRAERERETISETPSRLEDEFETVKGRVERALGLRRTIGPYLRKKRAQIPDPREHTQGVRQRLARILEAEIRLADYQEQRESFRELEPHLNRISSRLSPSLSEQERSEVMSGARELLEARREYLQSIVNDLDTYISKLVETNVAERQLISVAREYGRYIDEHIFWLRSAPPITPSQLPRAWEATAWLTRPNEWLQILKLAYRDFTESWPSYGLFLVVLAVLMFPRRRMRERLAVHPERLKSAETDSFFYTLEASVYTLLMAAPLPLVLWFLAWRLAAPLGATDLSLAVAAGLRAVATPLLMLQILIKACSEDGLASVHFRWRSEGVEHLRRVARWFVVIALPLAFLHGLLANQANEAWCDSLGRFVFIVLMIADCVLLQRLLRPSGSFTRDLVARSPRSVLPRLRYLFCGMGVFLPLALAGAAALGYYYTARQLTARLEATLLFVTGLLLVDAGLKRLVFVLRRVLGLRKARELALARKAEVSEAPTEATETVRPQESKVDLRAISTQTGRLLTTLMLVALLVGLWTIWSDTLTALAALDRVELWHTTAPAEEAATAEAGAEPVAETKVAISLADVILAVIIAAVTFIAAKNVPGLLEMLLLKRLFHEEGLRFALTALARYTIIVVGVIVALQFVEIGWSKVQWLAAAITFGLAFGLQEIVANFVSGLILLFERPLRPGDVVTVGGTSGTVTQIRIRATTITDFDRKELVIPNKEFITGTLINWTLTNQILRIVIPVGIAYGSDTALARKILLKVADESPVVLKDPAPQALFLNFGSSSLDFELRIYIASIDHYLRAIDELHTAVDDAFREAGIEIAFPQQDIHLRSVHSDIPIIERPKGPKESSG